ncbi:MAG: hypothetical protein IKR87_05305 [Candidatus Methanomethylophilaceae archaeon]|nr:hypothetical protein [Candidatus Methanomethylophilaceae archaeon]
MEYLDEKGQTVYNLRAEDVPEWEMYVVCTGSAGKGILRLDHITRNLFDKTALIPIQTAKNGLIEEYIKACHIIDSMADGNGKYAKDAVSKALDACRDSCGRSVNSSTPEGRKSWDCTSSISMRKRQKSMHDRNEERSDRRSKKDNGRRQEKERLLAGIRRQEASFQRHAA